MGLSNELSCEGGNFSCYLNPHRCFQSEVLGVYFPALEPWVVQSVSFPHFSSQLSTCKCGVTSSTSCHLASRPLHPSCPTLPLLPVWMNGSSWTPWLSDFHTVQFSGSSGCLLFLNLLLSFFCLYKEAKYIYLHLHLAGSLIFPEFQNPSPHLVYSLLWKG